MNCVACNKFGTNCMYKNKFGMCPYGGRRVASFPSSRPAEFTHQRTRGGIVLNQFGMLPCGGRRVASFPSSRPAEFTHQRTRGGIVLNQFGTKQENLKGFGGLRKKTLTDFYILNGITVDMSATKNKLFNNLKKIYSNITPTDIKLSVSSTDTLANIRASKHRQKEAEEKAKKEESERRAREKRYKIKKITYSPRESQALYEFMPKRLPAGSKVKRLTRPEVKQVDMDDLADMFSATRASPDELSDLLGKFSVKFGK